MSRRTTELGNLLEPAIKALGFRLWGIEYIPQGRHSLLRVYLDKEGGIDIEDCAIASRQISSILDVEDPITGEYTLEVSSPGLDRRLYTLAQYEAFKGSKVKLSLSKPFNGKRRFTGLLCGIEGDEVVVRMGDEETLFPIEQIDRANVVPEYK